MIVYTDVIRCHNFPSNHMFESWCKWAEEFTFIEAMFTERGVVVSEL